MQYTTFRLQSDAVVFVLTVWLSSPNGLLPVHQNQVNVDSERANICPRKREGSRVLASSSPNPTPAILGTTNCLSRLDS